MAFTSDEPLLSAPSCWYASRGRVYLVSGTKKNEITNTAADNPVPRIYQLPGPIAPAIGEANNPRRALMMVWPATCHMRKVLRSWMK
jgi:hypothetical protein